jgi:hypothetical protein
MSKRNKIIYWISTAWLALGMLSTGLVQMLHVKGEVEFILRLGYPGYFLTFLGICKILGVVVILVNNFTLVKEWAYAGFFFMMSGALFSHLAAGSPMNEIFPPVLLLLLTCVSWYFRPANRRIIAATSARAIYSTNENSNYTSKA